MEPNALLLALVLSCAGQDHDTQTPTHNLPPVPFPKGNEITPEKAMLGKVLYWDEQLSSTRTVACGTCHITGAGGEDPRTVTCETMHPGVDGKLGTDDDVVGSPGVPCMDEKGNYMNSPVFGMAPQVTGRQSPPSINAAYAKQLFWDGRASSIFTDPITEEVVLAEGAALESQVAGPPGSSVEMSQAGRDWGQIAERVSKSDPLALGWSVPKDMQGFIGERSYPQLFEQVYGTPEVTPVRIIKAIATYERTLISDRAPFDYFVLGHEDAFTPDEEAGMWIFFDHCEKCHPPPEFMDNRYHNIGVAPIDKDYGRKAVTGREEDAGKFKTPDIRNISLRAPYFHDGSARTLKDVVDFYGQGGIHHVNQAPLAAQIRMDEEQKRQLLLFLEHGVLDPRVRDELPPFDRPKLYTESKGAPSQYGGGTAGAKGLMPEVIAIEPPLHGTDSMTLAVYNCRPGAKGYLLLDREKGSQVVQGAELLVGMSDALRSIPVTIDEEGGHASVDISLPADREIIGTEFYAQWVIEDPDSEGGLAASRGVYFKVL